LVGVPGVRNVGARVGSLGKRGAKVGGNVGETDGRKVGVKEGEEEGARVGTVDGPLVGWSVG
jgi:hypothetical protein